MQKLAAKLRSLAAATVRNHQLSIALMAILAVPFSLLWNTAIVPELRGVEPLTYWKSVALLLVILKKDGPGGLPDKL
jgi:hypothetical protein